MNDQRDFDILQILSIILGYQNLMENRQQTAANNVQEANDKQAAYLLADINAKFEEQKELLQKIFDELSEKDGDK